jgi:activator of 2-hydroxyglutaryl-CoA dehydratase/predicted nucleotide-binding protein (sugar kinase/HSP70/actin superfamily)
MSTATDTELVIGMDIGSTTVKAVVMHRSTQEIVWSDYQRHQTKQPEKVLELLEEILRVHPEISEDGAQMFVTGSGSGPIGEATGAKFVQEVNAVTFAVEKLHPDVRSVVELGGQDAKIIIFKEDAEGNLMGSPSMNDKCASGTGATIDKCMIKVGAEPGYATSLHFDESALHHVAAKCGVFAETDVVNLIKSGIPKNEVLNSLADAIVMQNLSVLTRGSTMRPKVLLLGGPNKYLPFLKECWQLRIPETWADRGFEAPANLEVEDLIFVPENADLYAAFGAAAYGISVREKGGVLHDVQSLLDFIANGRRAKLGDKAGPPLSATEIETNDFVESYRIPRFVPPPLEEGEVVRAVIGMDGGSTSSKAVLIREDGEIVAKAYQLSKGNPIQDALDLMLSLKTQVEAQGATIECLGMGATGYAADVLEEVALADVNIVETVAHMMSAVHYFGDVDVICDIGGQDIKVLFMKNGDISNFKLSNSCSAGNGMLLQAMADQFGVPIQEYASTAFEADLAPKFSYGCAVFLDTDRVNFQKEGFQKQELLAGLAQVLPKNVWQYVVQIPRLASLGTKFVLQGGTQYNLAAVKAQVDYIKDRVPGAEVFVHPHTGEAGAIGAAFECLRLYERTGETKFIGIDAFLRLDYATKNDESTTCHFCPNECSRTFIDTKRPDGSMSRYISGFSCEKGTVESKEAMLELVKERKKIAAAYPNMMQYEARIGFQHKYDPEPLPETGTEVDDVQVTQGILRTERRAVRRGFERSNADLSRIRVGMPRVLGMYNQAPFFRGYFEALGLRKQNVVFSDPTDEHMWQEGGRYGSIDPCFPAKVVQAHIHNLLFHKHDPDKGRALNYIFFPILNYIPSFITDTMDNVACPVVSGTPEVMKSAFTKESDFFADRDIEYISDAVSIEEPNYLKRNMFDIWGERFGITQDESDFAVDQGLIALERFNLDVQDKGRAILETVEAEDDIAILVLGRSYHSDPGMNHGIPEEFQVLGYPILSIRSIPKSREYLDRYFKEELESGKIGSPLEISHIWPENYQSESSSRVWGANFAAHHPNVAILDLSSFKCGNDAPTYGLVNSIITAARTPSAALHDLDANKPDGSIKIRVKTYSHSLKLKKERLDDVSAKKRTLELSIERKRLQLYEAKQKQLESMRRRDPKIDRAVEMLRERVSAYELAEREHANARGQDPGLIQIRLNKKPGSAPAHA